MELNTRFYFGYPPLLLLSFCCVSLLTVYHNARTASSATCGQSRNTFSAKRNCQTFGAHTPTHLQKTEPLSGSVYVYFGRLISFVTTLQVAFSLRCMLLQLLTNRAKTCATFTRMLSSLCSTLRNLTSRSNSQAYSSQQSCAQAPCRR